MGGYQPVTPEQKRAYDLLCRYLSAGQRQGLDDLGRFIEVGKSLREYVIYVGVHGRSTVCGHCIGLTNWHLVPVADQALTLLMAIRADEPGFRRTSGSCFTMWPPPGGRRRSIEPF